MEMEQHILESGQSLQTHPRTACLGTWCCIHAQMPGPWSAWPRLWREDMGIMERVCPCGVGHPVAEMYEHAIFLNREYMLVHGCCGCPCSPANLPKWGREVGLLESTSNGPILAELGRQVDDLLIDVALYLGNSQPPPDEDLVTRLQEFLMAVRKLTKE
jgi:hypothetical protein